MKIDFQNLQGISPPPNPTSPENQILIKKNFEKWQFFIKIFSLSSMNIFPKKTFSRQIFP